MMAVFVCEFGVTLLCVCGPHLVRPQCPVGLHCCGAYDLMVLPYDHLRGGAHEQVQLNQPANHPGSVVAPATAAGAAVTVAVDDHVCTCAEPLAIL
jgi:hypothetical protein